MLFCVVSEWECSNWLGFASGSRVVCPFSLFDYLSARYVFFFWHIRRIARWYRLIILALTDGRVTLSPALSTPKQQQLLQSRFTSDLKRVVDDWVELAASMAIGTGVPTYHLRWGRILHNPLIIRPRLLNILNYKIGYSTTCTFQNRPNNPRRFWRMVLSYSILFISAEFLKNYNKSQKIQKLKIKFCWTPREYIYIVNI